MSLDGRVAIDSNRRGLESVVSVAAMAQKLFREAEQDLFDVVKDGAHAVVLQRRYDSTPMMLRFGRLQQELLHHARYLKKYDPPEGAPGQYPRWKVVSFREHKQDHPRSNPQQGILELMASSSTLFSCTLDYGLGDDSWESSVVVQKQPFKFAPCVLERVAAPLRPWCSRWQLAIIFFVQAEGHGR